MSVSTLERYIFLYIYYIFITHILNIVSCVCRKRLYVLMDAWNEARRVW